MSLDDSTPASLRFSNTIEELQRQLETGLHSYASCAVYLDGAQVFEVESGVPVNIYGDEIDRHESHYEANLDHSVSSESQGNEENRDVQRHTIRPRFRVFSCGKAMVSAIVWRLMDRGKIHIDDQISKYWSEFSQRGKSNVTVRHALTHTSGLPNDFAKGDINWGDWGRMTDILAALPAEYETGKVIHYHPVTFGWIIGELVARVTGSSFNEAFQHEVAEPLLLRDTSFTIDVNDDANRSLCVQLKTSQDFYDQDMPYKMNWLLDAEVNAPGATCISTANDLARLYSAVCNSGVLDDVPQWLSPDAAANVYAPHMRGYDIEEMVQKSVGQGVWLSDDGELSATAASPGSRTFGHGGMGTCIAWGDPDHNVGVAILTDTMQLEKTNIRRLNRISAAVRQDLGIDIGKIATI